MTTDEHLMIATLGRVSVPFVVASPEGLIVAVMKSFKLRRPKHSDVDSVAAPHVNVSTRLLVAPHTLQVSEAVARFGIGEKKLRKLIKEGTVKIAQRKKPLRIYEYSLREYLEGNPI